ncbi:hypothetical protein CP8484711_1838B, partial [Chlamydia psittaci 84-8471/1]|jgi:hypothetical protein
LK